jgi:hypothetical protein
MMLKREVPEMPRPVQVYSILLAGPSDTEERVQVAKAAMDRWNHQNSKATGILLMPKHWITDSTPEYGGSPQDLLNKQLVD